MRYILWDFDGTLAYRDGIWDAALLEVVRRGDPDSRVTLEDLRPHLQSGFPWHHHDRVREAGQSAEEWWSDLEPVFESALTQAAGFSQAEARRLARTVRDVFVDLTYWHLFDDTLKTLGTLQAHGWTHVIVSNHVPELPEIVRYLGLSPLISRVYNSASLGVEKPNPKIFQRVLADLAPYRDVWMVGDNFNADYLGAEAVGIKAILVRSANPGASRYAENLELVLPLLGVKDAAS